MKPSSLSITIWIGCSVGLNFPSLDRGHMIPTDGKDGQWQRSIKSIFVLNDCNSGSTIPTSTRQQQQHHHPENAAPLLHRVQPNQFHEETSASLQLLLLPRPSHLEHMNQRWLPHLVATCASKFQSWLVVYGATQVSKLFGAKCSDCLAS